MAGWSTYLKNSVLDHINGHAALAEITVYLAAFVGDPATTSGTEVAINTTTAYARQAVTFGAANAGAATNSAQVNFPVAGASWGTISHLAAYDASTSGHLLWSGAISPTKAIGTGDQLTVPIGSLSISET